MANIPPHIKNQLDNMTLLDHAQVLKRSYNDENTALDVVSVDTLVHERFYKVSCTYITLPNGDIEVETITYYGLGKNQLQTIDCAGYAGGKGEITLLSFSGQTPGALDGKYFTIYDASGSVGVWFNLDGGSVHPTTGALRDIEVGINSGDDVNQLAATLSATILLDSQFYATSVGFNVAIITQVVGNKTNSSAGTSGLIITSQDGIPSMNNTWFSINTINNTSVYYVWYNVDGAGVDPTPIPLAIPIMVNLIGSDTDQLVAQKTAAAINATNNLYLIASVSLNRIVAKYGLFGPSTGIVNGNTRHIISLQEQGVIAPTVAKLLVSYGTNNEISQIERIAVNENPN